MPYCRKTMSAMDRLFIHMKIQPHEGDWDIETCPKLQPNDTPRDKWAKILLRTKENISEVRLRGKKYPQQPTEEIYTKASDRIRKKEKKRKKEMKKCWKRINKGGKRGTHCGNNTQYPPYRIINTEPEIRGKQH